MATERRRPNMGDRVHIDPVDPNNYAGEPHRYRDGEVTGYFNDDISAVEHNSEEYGYPSYVYDNDLKDDSGQSYGEQKSSYTSEDDAERNEFEELERHVYALWPHEEEKIEADKVANRRAVEEGKVKPKQKSSLPTEGPNPKKRTPQPGDAVRDDRTGKRTTISYDSEPDNRIIHLDDDETGGYYSYTDSFGGSGALPYDQFFDHWVDDHGERFEKSDSIFADDDSDYEPNEVDEMHLEQIPYVEDPIHDPTNENLAREMQARNDAALEHFDRWMGESDKKGASNKSLKKSLILKHKLTPKFTKAKPWPPVERLRSKLGIPKGTEKASEENVAAMMAPKKPTQPKAESQPAQPKVQTPKVEQPKPQKTPQHSSSTPSQNARIEGDDNDQDVKEDYKKLLSLMGGKDKPENEDNKLFGEGLGRELDQLSKPPDKNDPKEFARQFDNVDLIGNEYKKPSRSSSTTRTPPPPPPDSKNQAKIPPMPNRGIPPVPGSKPSTNEPKIPPVPTNEKREASEKLTPEVWASKVTQPIQRVNAWAKRNKANLAQLSSMVSTALSRGMSINDLLSKMSKNQGGNKSKLSPVDQKMVSELYNAQKLQIDHADKLQPPIANAAKLASRLGFNYAKLDAGTRKAIANGVDFWDYLAGITSNDKRIRSPEATEILGDYYEDMARSIGPGLPARLRNRPRKGYYGYDEYTLYLDHDMRYVRKGINPNDPPEPEYRRPQLGDHVNVDAPTMPHHRGEVTDPDTGWVDLIEVDPIDGLATEGLFLDEIKDDAGQSYGEQKADDDLFDEDDESLWEPLTQDDLDRNEFIQYINDIRRRNSPRVTNSRTENDIPNETHSAGERLKEPPVPRVPKKALGDMLPEDGNEDDDYLPLTEEEELNIQRGMDGSQRCREIYRTNRVRNSKNPSHHSVSGSHSAGEFNKIPSDVSRKRNTEQSED